jgi:RimJ/RimL family protein N-acetyltransferase
MLEGCPSAHYCSDPVLSFGQRPMMTPRPAGCLADMRISLGCSERLNPHRAQCRQQQPSVGSRTWARRARSNGSSTLKDSSSTARLHSFREDGSARYAVGFFDPQRLGRGFGTEVTAVVAQYAFGPLGLQRLDLAVLEFNERAIRYYRRCGLREVGRSSEVVVIDGEPHHDILMEITPAALRDQA